MGRSTDKETRLSEHRKYRKFTAKQKLEIVLASLHGDRSVAELCREHQIAESLLRKWREPGAGGGGGAVRVGPGADAAVVEHAVAVHGIRKGELVLGSDNGSAFTARRFKAKLGELGIKHCRGGYPSSAVRGQLRGRFGLGFGFVEPNRVGRVLESVGIRFMSVIGYVVRCCAYCGGHVLADDAAAAEGRLAGALPAAGAQPARGWGDAGGGAAQPRPRGRARRRGAAAAGPLDPPLHRPGRRGRRPDRAGRGARGGRLASARRRLAVGCALAAAADRGDARPAARPAALHDRCRAGAVRARLQPGARAVLEAGRGRVGLRGRGDPGPGGDGRRSGLPGARPAGRGRRGGEAAGGGLLRLRRPAEPRGRSALLRHHLDLLRGRARQRRGEAERRRFGRSATRRTTGPTCRRS